MPLNKTHLVRLGASARYQELMKEARDIRRAFPDVATEPMAKTPGRRVNKRPPLSAAGRKAISIAQKARWAKFKARKDK